MTEPARAKTELNAFDVRAAVRELKALRGSRFDKAYDPAPGEILLRLRAFQPARKVDISILVGKALHLTTHPKANPEKPSSFVMQLRKHIANAFVDDVRQHGFDRVIEFVSQRKDGRYLLVVELFHDGNVVLVKDDRILTPLVHQSWAHREVRPGAPWIPPPARSDPSLLTLDEFAAKVRPSRADAVRTLATEINLGGPVAEEVCARAGVPKGTPIATLADEQVAALHAALLALMERLDTGELDPVVALRGGEMVDVAPFPLAAHEGLELRRFPSFHEALDAYFGKPTAVGERADPRLVKLETERTKVQRMHDAQVAALARFDVEEAEAKRKGDLLYAHFQLAQDVARQVLEASKTLGWKEVQARLKGANVKIVDAVDPHQGTAVLRLDDEQGKSVKVKLDLRKSVQENADAYYALSKKLREKRKGATAALALTKARMKDLEERGLEIVASLHEKEKRRPGTKRFWFEAFRWFVTSDGHVVIAGRDARSNERIVARNLEDNDRYLHAEVSGAPSTIVKAKEGAVSEAALEEAACFAASMSRIWSAGHASGEAYWVTPQQVSKTPNPGEYVAKGSFIVRGKRNFLRVPIRLAVGEVEIEGARKVMGGPVGAVASRSARYLVLEPGETSTNDLANRLADVFDVPVEEVQAVLPPGGVRVVEEHGL